MFCLRLGGGASNVVCVFACSSPLGFDVGCRGAHFPLQHSHITHSPSPTFSVLPTFIPFPPSPPLRHVTHNAPTTSITADPVPISGSILEYLPKVSIPPWRTREGLKQCRPPETTPPCPPRSNGGEDGQMGRLLVCIRREVCGGGRRRRRQGSLRHGLEHLLQQDRRAVQGPAQIR